MDLLINENAKAFTDRWFKSIWQDNKPLTDYFHEDAMLFGGNRTGVDIVFYDQYRQAMLKSVRFDSNEVTASVASERHIQSMGVTHVTHRVTGLKAILSGAHSLYFEGGKVMVALGFFDRQGLANILTREHDQALIDIFGLI